MCIARGGTGWAYCSLYVSGCFSVIVPIHIPSAMYGSAHHRTGVCVLCSTKRSSVAAEEGRAGGGQFYVPTSIHSVQLSCFHIEHQQTFSGKKICMN